MGRWAIIFLLLYNLSLGQSATSRVLSWADCIAEAARYHPDLKIAGENVTQAKADITLSRSQELPRVTASASIDRRQAEINTNTSSVGITATQKIFDGGQNRWQTRQSKEALTQQDARYWQASAELRYKLQLAYIDLWQAQQAIQINENIVKVRQNSYDLINLKYTAGTEHKGARLSAKAKLSQANAALAAAKRSLRNNQIALAKAIGYPLEIQQQQPELAATDEIPFAIDNTTAPLDLHSIAKNNPSYRAAAAGIGVAQASLRSTQGSNWPTISLQAGAARSSNDIPPKENDYSLSANASYDIYDGSARSASIQKARSALRSAYANLQSTYNTLYANLRDSWDNLENSIDTAKVQAEFLEANIEREKIAQAQYTVGLTSYDSWTIIEDNLVNTQQAELTARANMLKAQAAWELASGTPL